MDHKARYPSIMNEGSSFMFTGYGMANGRCDYFRIVINVGVVAVAKKNLLKLCWQVSFCWVK